MAENLIPGFGEGDPGRTREPNGEATMAYGGQQSSGGPHGLGPSHDQLPKVGKFHVHTSICPRLTGLATV